jgi:ABC-2 type transport system permease protein
MSKGLPTKLPAGIVDEDNTHITHTAYRILNTLEETDIKYHFASFSEARKAMQEGRIFAFFYFRKGTTEKAIAGRQPEVSFFTNEAYFVPGTLLMKDMRTAGELIGLAITREELYLRGANEDRAMGVIRPHRNRKPSAQQFLS